jgi:hypothetical protein
MQWYINIEDAALSRLSWRVLKEHIELECDDLEMKILTQVKAARKQMGLEVEESGESTSSEPSPSDQEV